MEHIKDITPDLYEMHVGDLVASIICVSYIGGLSGATELFERNKKRWGHAETTATMGLICDVLEGKPCSDTIVKRVVNGALWSAWSTMPEASVTFGLK